MSETQKTTRLFEEFPPIKPQEWKEKIVTDLKGADYDKKLVWKTREGFSIQPFYTVEDIEKLKYLESNPSEFPFVRGNKKDNNQWRISQNICICDLKEANKKALKIANEGVDSIGFHFCEPQNNSISDIEVLINGLDIEKTEINFYGIVGIVDFTNILIEVLKKKNFKNIQGSVNYDPIGNHLTIKGKFCTTQQEAFNNCKTVLERFKSFENFKAITVSGLNFSDAGANTVQELALSLSIGNEYLTNLTDLGLVATEINKKLKFHFGVGGNYFFEIAKFRAARFLWAQILQKYNIPEDVSKMHIHAQTTEWNKTVYDPYTNMLRTTTEAMSAVLGGVESLVVDPFNYVFEDTTDFSERIARNQQIVLKEEAYFDKVIDPAAGSYYIENLTDEIAKSAWKLFLEIENKGGYIKAFNEGFIQNILNEEAKTRKNAIINRQENLLGINQYPNFTESKQEIDLTVLEPDNRTSKDAKVSGIIRYRGSQQLEKLRYRTDTYSLKNKRPLAFMVTYGPVAFSGARSQFSQNFFAIAGFKVQDNPNFETVEDGVNAAIQANADIVVLCSADEEYAQTAPKALEVLGNKGILVVAGFPKDIVDELKSKGIENFIHLRSNVLESLEGFQKKLGIK